MKLETSIKRIEQLGIERTNENREFRTFLESKDPNEIDKLVKRFGTEISANIICTDCGNCCRNIRSEASDEALIKFMDPEDFEEARYAESFVCKHLVDNKCSKYEDRYEECKDFPYIHWDGFTSRLTGEFINYGICPITYNLIEALKKELNWCFVHE
jgi:hypothetical protein